MKSAKLKLVERVDLRTVAGRLGIILDEEQFRHRQ
jgi:hypothetical protein